VSEDASLLELLYLVPVGIVRCDPSGHVQMLNPAATAVLMELTGGAPADNVFEVFEQFEPSVRPPADAPSAYVRTSRLKLSEERFLEVAVTRPTASDFILVFRDVSALVSRERQLEVLATTDMLTNLVNRRAMRERIAGRLVSLQRYGGEAALLFLDLDDFKGINDTHGHDAGDAVLVAFAHTLKQTVRECDVAARWGGEEFAVLCESTPLQGAIRTAERIREAVEQIGILHNGQMLRVTVSIGVAQLTPEETVDEACARADEALYAAKHAGRNTFSVAR
jgi:diguanylate cyclase (GGDEF)-like protein